MLWCGMNVEMLQDQGQFSIWLDIQLRADKSIDSIVDSILIVDHPISHFRASNVYFKKTHLNVADIDFVYRLLARAYAEGDRYVQLLAEITHLNVRLTPLDGTWPPEKLEILAVKPVLKVLIDEVRELQSHPLKFEIEWRLYFSLLAAAFASENKEEIDTYSAVILEIAKLRNDSWLTNYASRERAAALYKLGRYSESAHLYLNVFDLNNLRPEFHGDYQTISNLLGALLNLGALQAMSDLTTSLHANPAYGDIAGIHIFSKILLGEHVESKDTGWYYDWQNQSLHLSLQAEEKLATPRVASERVKLLNQILDAPLEGVYLTDIVFNRWMRARTRLILGEPSLAIGEMGKLPPVDAEDLLNRLLIAALTIEISMSTVDLPINEIKSAAQELRSVFVVARNLDRAEPESLMKVLLRWHAHAAVYGALMPDPVPELLPALDNVVRIRERSTWRGKAIPNLLLPFLIRQGLRIKATMPRLSGNALAQLKKLRDERYNMAIWGPTVTAPPVALAFVRSGDIEIATTVLREFGSAIQREDDLELYSLIESLWQVTENSISYEKMLQQLAFV